MSKTKQSKKHANKKVGSLPNTAEVEITQKVSEADSDKFTKKELLLIAAIIGGCGLLISCLLFYLRLKH